jgi:RHS repeat-associated protein
VPGQQHSADDAQRTHLTSAAVSPPHLALPKGGGALRGIGEKFTVNAATGTGTMTVPITTSAARGGFGPQLALSYDSGAGNGPFGLGWHLSVPAITRRTDRGLPRYGDADESDTYILSSSEDLVPELTEIDGAWQRVAIQRVVDGETFVVQPYRPRTEGLFARIERWVRMRNGDIFWRSISKDNVTTFYGKSALSRVADSSDSRRIFSWLICESFDDKGNAIVYEYAAEDSAHVDVSLAHERNRSESSRAANRYLKRIRYGNTTSRLVEPDLTRTTWLFEVIFDYGEGHLDALPSDAQGREFVNAAITGSRRWPVRQDAFSTYRAAFEVRTYRLCRRVLMFHHFPGELGVSDCLVRSTEFVYRETPLASFITSVTQSGYQRQSDDSYLRRSLPPLEFEYSETTLREDVREVDPESLANLPGRDNDDYHWLDLDGEGVPSVLAEADGGWYYKRNISPLSLNDGQAAARFEPVTDVVTVPSFAESPSSRHRFLDLAGDGQLDCVVLDRPAGFFERTTDEDWEAFRALPSVPNIDWNDRNLRFLDLDGDGHADVLVTEGEAFTVYASLAEAGFRSGVRVPNARDEELGPAIVFSDAAQTIFLADMSGDGLTDIVRVHNGEACYWPNLGYGRFGPKVTMGQAPFFDTQEQFDPTRLRLADIDGSGVADIIYLGHDGLQLYFNQSGNAWSAPHILAAFPPLDELSSVQAIDLLGNGTACLVWMSVSPNDARHSMRYVDLVGGVKPHLLTRSRNNLGAETRIDYAPSTKFYLADRAAGQLWVTRLPFPVQVVERLETLDHVSRNRFVTRYTYHHGYFDGVEREFRGFARVDHLDTEELGVLTNSGTLPDATNIDAASYVPPVLTKTWFHTGAFLDGQRISRYLEHEYYRESDLSEGVTGLTERQAELMLLDDTVLPDNLDLEQIREACRSLKGTRLRQEVYALDGTEETDRPYCVSESNYTIRSIQPFGPNSHAVFFTHTREILDLHYERKLYDIGARQLADPRVSHHMALALDDFGNELQSVTIGYARRHDDHDKLLRPEDKARQNKIQVTLTESAYTNAILQDDQYRVPLPAEVRTYELIKVQPDGAAPDVTNLFTVGELLAKTARAGDGRHDLPYEDIDARGAIEAHPYRRLIEQVRSLYRKDDLSGALMLGAVEPRALPFENYKLALTPGLLSLFQREQSNLLPDPVSVLRNDGGYVSSDDKKREGFFPQSDPNGQWWVPSGQTFYSSNAADPAPQELSHARSHFFVMQRYVDLFGAGLTVGFDDHDLLVLETTDALGNRVTIGERQSNNSIINGNDYRVLQPALLTNPNGNRSAVAFDALGLVVATAVMSKPSERRGDSLSALAVDLTQLEIDTFLADPTGPAAATLMRSATTRLVYDLGCFARDSTAANPVYAASIARETHVSDLNQLETSRLRVSFEYSDGFGRVIQRKIPAEPGPVVRNEPTVAPRWVASGWTVFNNKGSPVRQFQPFFDDTHAFRFGNAVDVSSVLFYDPIGRVVARVHPNHAWEKLVVDPWRQESWDVNDTVLGADPALDRDVGPFFRRLPDREYLPTWHSLRAAGAMGLEERDAARKAATHAGTPSVEFFDTLGRVFLSLLSNGPAAADHLRTDTELDIEGNTRAVIDALDRRVMIYDYDMLGGRVHQNSIDAGQRWMLNDAAGKAMRAWDERAHNVRHVYDALQRPTGLFVQTGGGGERLVERVLYGEAQSDPETTNIRGEIFQHFDGAGVVTHERYDFKGNLLTSIRQLLRDYRDEVDWAQGPALEAETHASRTRFDALNRAVAVTTPDGSVVHTAYNGANLLERVDVNLRGANTPTPFITNIDYDAKGQRTQIDFGSGASTSYDYDLNTFRLVRLRTTRGTDHARLQDLSYFYDAFGNITQIVDSAQQTIYFDNQVVTGAASYVCDALYRLIEARGREHIGQRAQPQTTDDDVPRMNLPLPTDGQAMRSYNERYSYDGVGNILSIAHLAANASWTRTYAYDEPNGTATRNRLTSTTVAALREPYGYDRHGNMVRMPHLSAMEWDFRDQLHATQRQVVNNASGEKTYYAYDAAGHRVRKVTEHANQTKKAERIYLDGFEIYREYDGSGRVVAVERETVPVMDNTRRIALVETRTQGVESDIPQQVLRYQHDNHLGSACLELDQNAAVISYEEYYPYGSTSYQSGRSQAEVSLKRYRFIGQERDDETGLTYHGARYYAPWLGRWTSCDPAEMTDGVNVYAYGRENPVDLIDPSGTQNVQPKATREDQDRFEAEERAFERQATVPFYSNPQSGDVLPTIHSVNTGNKAADIALTLFATGYNQAAQVINARERVSANLEQGMRDTMKRAGFNDPEVDYAQGLVSGGAQAIAGRAGPRAGGSPGRIVMGRGRAAAGQGSRTTPKTGGGKPATPAGKAAPEAKSEKKGSPQSTVSRAEQKRFDDLIRQVKIEDVTDPRERAALSAALNEFRKVYRSTGDYHKAATAAGVEAHRLFGSRGPGQGIDFVEGELKTQWPSKDEMGEREMRAGLKQVLKYAAESGTAPKPVKHYVVDIKTGKAVTYTVDPSMFRRK